jgi:hypothetical protein
VEFVSDLDEDQQLHDRLLEKVEMDRDGYRFGLAGQHPDPMSWIQNA